MGVPKLHGELAGLGVKAAALTVWEILKKAGIDLAPRRSGLAWSQFLRSQAEAILPCDFFTADLLDGTHAYVLAVIEHATRRIRILGVTLYPTGEWTCGCRKPVSPGQMLCTARSRVQCRASRSWPVRTCDDLRLVGLKLIFLTVSGAMSLLRLSRREEWWKDAEILMLRHQLAVALRERPRAAARLTWPDRAWLALLTRTLPIDRLAGIAADRHPGHDLALAP